MGLNEQEVKKNRSGGLLNVSKGDFKGPLNELSQKIFSWESSEQS